MRAEFQTVRAELRKLPLPFGVCGIVASVTNFVFNEVLLLTTSCWNCAAAARAPADRCVAHALLLEIRLLFFEDVEVLPKPLQSPHPPVWVASGSPDAIAWSASKGFSILMDPHADAPAKEIQQHSTFELMSFMDGERGDVRH